SVAEQEGQQTETEATGAPQKHHYTLNQQVGSITNSITLFCGGRVFCAKLGQLLPVWRAAWRMMVQRRK
ncbi:hypothetical protein ACLBPG_18585, partial [Klebsiella pneumoniae]|uniref:hypothetical protein n=2 Tax=Klebsiella pneumoniae TaxID=573 RepID=UPI0039698EE2